MIFIYNQNTNAITVEYGLTLIQYTQCTTTLHTPPYISLSPYSHSCTENWLLSARIYIYNNINKCTALYIHIIYVYIYYIYIYIWNAHTSFPPPLVQDILSQKSKNIIVEIDVLSSIFFRSIEALQTLGKSIRADRQPYLWLLLNEPYDRVMVAFIGMGKNKNKN